MGSKTLKTKRIRKNKLKASGKKRKNANENKGTTPKFPIHKDK